jgi:hypothetical protein
LSFLPLSQIGDMTFELGGTLFPHQNMSLEISIETVELPFIVDTSTVWQR